MKDYSGLLFNAIFILRNRMNIFLFSSLIKTHLRIKGVRIGRGVKLNGYMKINRYPNSRIIIGDYCRFNSSRNSVALSLSERCTLVTLSEGAEIRIGNHTGVSGLTVASAGRVTIGEKVIIGASCTIVDNDFHNPDPSKRGLTSIPSNPVEIGDQVFLGMNVMILKGVTIGKNAVIGANSVVMSSIPENAVALGNPCKVLIKRNW